MYCCSGFVFFPFLYYILVNLCSFCVRLSIDVMNWTLYQYQCREFVVLAGSTWRSPGPLLTNRRHVASCSEKFSLLSAAGGAYLV